MSTFCLGAWHGSFKNLQVFEDDHFLSQASDSGCPSESLLEEEEVLNKTHLGLPAVSHRSQGNSMSHKCDVSNMHR